MQDRTQNIKNIYDAISMLIVLGFSMGLLGTFITNEKEFILTCLLIIGVFLILKSVLEIIYTNIISSNTMQKIAGIVIGTILVIMSLKTFNSFEPVSICFGRWCATKPDTVKYIFR